MFAEDALRNAALACNSHLPTNWCPPNHAHNVSCVLRAGNLGNTGTPGITGPNPGRQPDKLRTPPSALSAEDRTHTGVQVWGGPLYASSGPGSLQASVGSFTPQHMPGMAPDWDETAPPPSRTGRSKSTMNERPGSRAGAAIYSAYSQGVSGGKQHGHRPHHRSLASSQGHRSRQPHHCMSEPEAGLGNGVGLLYRPASRSQRQEQQPPPYDQAAQQGVAHISMDTTDDAAAFFRAAGQMLQPGTQVDGTMSGAWARPPPAGMRGALSWGVGPNAYENDGRPGTRSGGMGYDLEGRPLTRSGLRPPSRMQTGLTGTQPGPASGTGQCGPNPAAVDCMAVQTAGLGSPHHRGRGGLSSQQGPRSGLGSFELETNSQLRRPASQAVNTTGGPNTLRGGAGTGRTGRGESMSRGGAGRVGSRQCGGRREGGAESSGGLGACQQAGSSLASGVFKVDEEGDVDAFLDALGSGDEEVGGLVCRLLDAHACCGLTRGQL